MAKPKLKDYRFPNDVTGEQAYEAYRADKKEWRITRIKTAQAEKYTYDDIDLAMDRARSGTVKDGVRYWQFTKLQIIESLKVTSPAKL
jgi:hypothetical protein